MSITLVIQRRAKPGRAEEAVALLGHLIGGGIATGVQRQSAQVFQSVSDPELFLSIARWESRAAAETYVRAADAGLEALMLGPSEAWYCRSLASFERMLVRPALLAGSVTFATPATRAEVAELLVETVRDRLRRAPGCVHYDACQDLDEPSRLIAIHGWDSAASLERARADINPTLQARLSELGAESALFIGQIRVSHDLYR